MGGRDGRAGDAPLDRASTAAGAWTRAVTSARLDRPHQVDGAVENANGRLRRDLPRDLDLDALGDAELQEIVLSHNLTPRKCLGFLTPLQALLKELGKDVQIR